MMRLLKEVSNFGAIAAEDDDLRRFFVQTPVYDELLKAQRQIVVGRKGSGKTALHLALLARSDDDNFFARGLTFSDYPWALHARYVHEATTRHERFLASWRFLLFIEIFKVLLTEKHRYSRYSAPDAETALNSVERFIQNNWGTLAFDYKKTFPSGGFRMDGVSIAPQVAGFSLGGVNVKSEGSLSATLERLNEWLWHALITVGSDAPRIFVLFDELDAGYEPTSEDYVDRVIGLLLAVRKLSRDFSDAGLPFHPIAFLRSDIYDTLHFGDKNKLTEANVTWLAWTDDLEYRGCSLKQLIDHRIREALELPPTVRDPWSRAFDVDLMRGTQHKFLHMTFRSHMRPRDIIKFANCALDEFRRRTRSGNGDSLISNDDIIAARKDYSHYLLRELDDEIAASTPRWSDYMEVLRRIKATRFTMQAFIAALEDLKDRAALDVGAEDLLHFFYRHSIVGFERAAGASGLTIHFRYQDEKIRFNPAARSFMVHRGLKEALELRDSGEAVDSIV